MEPRILCHHLTHVLLSSPSLPFSRVHPPSPSPSPLLPASLLAIKDQNILNSKKEKKEKSYKTWVAYCY